MATINLALNVQVVGGPTVLISKSKSVQAYDKIEVAIEAGSEKSVDVQPGAADKVSFLLIKSSVYSSEQSVLTYRVSDGNSDFPDSTQPAKPPIALDEPHLYFGLGAVSAFGLAPKILKFTNSTGTPAAIEILVGRDAI
jgi:hypothetical protein